ncbi:head-tail connector protein [Variovorax ginsengisoli]|uniref:Phage head-tail connector protein n=1 Tax=Variovorax ginsengisoli TaxID=363844 RepID=A0ABT8SDP2_9BURK|nr:phage head-tail connector protein [Variovorax ginsengisoli]MDN8617869.1 phage head-tail connector protein [Variovorax ginsengisoli]MDO1537039.1 phage head-tail connector protein [Variovorax ginsengisoli]
MLIQTTPPSIEPVSIAEVKLNSRIIDTSDDVNLALLIGAARRYAESYTGRSFITQGWRLVLDGFPSCLDLERGAVLSINSITYRDMGGATQTIAWGAAANGIQRSSDGTLVADLTSARIAPAFGSVWPIPMAEIGAVAVNYTAGYGPAAADVPEGVRHWIQMRVATLYENREEVAYLARGKIELLPFFDRLLDPYSIVLA